MLECLKTTTSQFGLGWLLPRNELSTRSLGGHACGCAQSRPFTGSWRLRLLIALAALTVCTCCSSTPGRAEILCADDIVPTGMAVTATGTAATCAGACRAREVKPVCGLVMKICAGEPIPKGYVLDSVTTMPACQCLGQEGNAFVIRYVGPQDDSVSYGDEESRYEDTLGSSSTEKLRSPYGDPPFGNVLCATNVISPEMYGNVSQPVPFGSGERQWGGYPLGGFLSGAPRRIGSGSSNGVPGSWPAPQQWNYQQNEPFRVGQ